MWQKPRLRGYSVELLIEIFCRDYSLQNTGPTTNIILCYLILHTIFKFNNNVVVLNA